jgi:hypothetical protein
MQDFTDTGVGMDMYDDEGLGIPKTTVYMDEMRRLYQESPERFREGGDMFNRLKEGGFSERDLMEVRVPEIRPVVEQSIDWGKVNQFIKDRQAEEKLMNAREGERILMQYANPNQYMNGGGPQAIPDVRQPDLNGRYVNPGIIPVVDRAIDSIYGNALSFGLSGAAAQKTYKLSRPLGIGGLQATHLMKGAPALGLVGLGIDSAQVGYLANQHMATNENLDETNRRIAEAEQYRNALGEQQRIARQQPDYVQAFATPEEMVAEARRMESMRQAHLQARRDDYVSNLNTFVRDQAVQKAKR